MISISKPMIGEDEKKSVLKVLDSGMLAQGEKVEEFEEKFAKYVGTKHAVATSSGTSALHLALLASAIKNGDEIITTPFTFISTATSILFCNAKPVFVDIDPKTFNLDHKKIENMITEKTRAILPVHLYGQPAKIDEIMEIAEEYELTVIEDACQAHGGEYKGKKVGSWGDLGCFSFYPTKNITTGEGGIVTTDNADLAENIRTLRNHGQRERYNYIWVGYNYRMTELAAAIGIEQLKKLDKFNQVRIEHAKFLSEELKDVVTVPYILPEAKHVFHQYTIKVRERDTLREKLAHEGIGTGVYYPKPLYNYKPLHMFAKGSLKNAENCSHHVLSLPVHPGVSNLGLKKISESVKKFV